MVKDLGIDSGGLEVHKSRHGWKVAFPKPVVPAEIQVTNERCDIILVQGQDVVLEMRQLMADCPLIARCFITPALANLSCACKFFEVVEVGEDLTHQLW